MAPSKVNTVPQALLLKTLISYTAACEKKANFWDLAGKNTSVTLGRLSAAKTALWALWGPARGATNHVIKATIFILTTMTTGSEISVHRM